MWRETDKFSGPTQIWSQKSSNVQNMSNCQRCLLSFEILKSNTHLCHRSVYNYVHLIIDSPNLCTWMTNTSKLPWHKISSSKTFLLPLGQEVHSQSPQSDQEDHLGQDHPRAHFKLRNNNSSTVLETTKIMTPTLFIWWKIRIGDDPNRLSNNCNHTLGPMIPRPGKPGNPSRPGIPGSPWLRWVQAKAVNLLLIFPRKNVMKW